MTNSVERLRDRTVGDIAAHVAGATAVFRQKGIDFCCGGDIPLAEAARQKGADIDALEGALSALGQMLPDVPRDTPDLVDYLLAHFHQKHRRDLPELIRLARKVEAVHEAHPDVPAGLASRLGQAQQDLEAHMQKEEQILFPTMRAAYTGGLDMPIFVMRREHDEHAVMIQGLETMTSGFRPPEGACRSWQALYSGLESFVNELKEHIHLENNVLFPRFQSRPV